jgi:hypothetical protein
VGASVPRTIKVLCVTFSRSLAAKLYSDFEKPASCVKNPDWPKIVEEDTEVYTPEPLGFVNHQNHKGDLNFEDSGHLDPTPCDNI